jgi:predicted transcriptional regulator
MATLTLEIPDELDTALEALSARRHEPKAAVIQAALETVLARESAAEDPAARWLHHWRGSLCGRETAAPGDERARHLLDKHLR